MSIVLEVKGISKAFKKKQVISNLSFAVLQNTIMGFVGRTEQENYNHENDYEVFVS